MFPTLSSLLLYQSHALVFLQLIQTIFFEYSVSNKFTYAHAGLSSALGLLLVQTLKTLGWYIAENKYLLACKCHI